MTTITSPLLDSSVLPMVELLALCLDGHLYRVGDVFAPADAPDAPELRASAFGRSVSTWMVADRESAAWIHGTRSVPPPLPQVCIPPHRRGGLAAAAVDACHRSLRPDETVSLGAVHVTTPLRTAVDLLSLPGTFDDQQALEVCHLLALAGMTPAETDARLRMSRRKGCALARSRLPMVAGAQLPGPVGPARSALGPVSPR